MRSLYSPPFLRLFLWIAIGVFLGVGSIYAYTRLDIERYRSDDAKIQRLAVADLPFTPLTSSDANSWSQWRGLNRDGISPETTLLDQWSEEGPRLVWQRPIGRGFSSFAIAQGRLVTMDQEGEGAEAKESITCLDAKSGAELWRLRYSNHYDERFGPGPRSTPAIDGDQVYAVGPTGIMHCLELSSGKIKWRRDLLQDFQAPAMQYGVAFSPLVDEESVYVTPGGPGGKSVAALDKATGIRVGKPWIPRPAIVRRSWRR